jgi:hypothetical protein
VPNDISRSLVPGILIPAALLGACSGSSPPSTGQAPLPGPDASQVLAYRPNPDAGDTFMFTPDASGALQAHIQVNGAGASCGSCVVVLAQAEGGQQPYSYTWSDPSWKGPGPFTVCPTQNTTVSLEVSGAASSSGEGTMSSSVANASTTIDCVPSDGSAGSGPGPLDGCQAHATSSSTSSDGGTADAGQMECTGNELDAAVAWADGGVAYSDSSSLPYTLLKGHTYQVSYDQLLPFEFGSSVIVDIYGATQANVCQADMLLFTLTLNGSIADWHQSYCFTPDRDYDYLITNVYIQGVLFYFDPLSVSTLCDTCTLAAGDD